MGIFAREIACALVRAARDRLDNVYTRALGGGIRENYLKALRRGARAVGALAFVQKDHLVAVVVQRVRRTARPLKLELAAQSHARPARQRAE